MKKETKHQNSEPLFTEIYLSGDGSREEKQSALKIMLTRCQPVAVGIEVFFLEEFEILEDL